MYPNRRKEVLEFLSTAPYEGHFKRQLLEGWVRTVGTKLRGGDYKRVYRSGIDHP